MRCTPDHRPRRRAWLPLTALALGASSALVAAPLAQASESPSASAGLEALAAAAADEDFFTYDGAEALEDLAPGAVLDTRTIDYHVAGISLPVDVVQVLYRTTDAAGGATANVTSVVLPPGGSDGTEAVAYQSFYDSLDVADSPSRVIAGDQDLGGAIVNIETALIAPLLAQGYPVIIADTQGPTANFAAGPEYGYTTLDSIRATRAVAETGLAEDAEVGLIGYSGGAIGTNWAATLAPDYAPDVNDDLVGATSGGLLVQASTNLEYISGTPIWAGVAGMAVVGVARAYDIDFTPYLSETGAEIFEELQDASIIDVLGQYPGLTWEQMVKPEYADPNSVPEFVEAVNEINLGLRDSPTVPLFLVQGTGGYLEGTPGWRPGVGAGDGVMVAGDVRTLARNYCADGVAVKYQEIPLASHTPAALAWLPQALVWLNDRFDGKQAPSNCASIRAGNPLDAEVVVTAG